MLLHVKTLPLKFPILALIAVLLLSCCKIKEAPLSKGISQTTSFNTLSEQFLQNIIDGKDTKAIKEQLANTSMAELKDSLKTDAQRYAFWINVYNAYIQVILREHPEYYEDRSAFFAEPQILIAGEVVSFAKIEHGILRKSQWELGLGYVRKWFPDRFERKLRVAKRDYRVHFALNCGAKDCPPVAIYTTERLEEQLQKSTALFLEKSTSYDAGKKEASVTSLFNWFRGDFGGKNGVKQLLEAHDLIPETKGVDLRYTNYDWTLALDNFITL